jgi:hypothetical protein
MEAANINMLPACLAHGYRQVGANQKSHLVSLRDASHSGFTSSLLLAPYNDAMMMSPAPTILLHNANNSFSCPPFFSVSLRNTFFLCPAPSPAQDSTTIPIATMTRGRSIFPPPSPKRKYIPSPSPSPSVHANRVLTQTQSPHPRRPLQASHPASQQGWQVHDHRGD